MSDSIAAGGGAQVTSAFRTALGAAAAQERTRQARRRDRVAALASLTIDDLGHLVTTFDVLVRGPASVDGLTAALHAALRELCPETREEGDDA
ncbi:MAG TPA: hypothetical protein VII06_33200 [Chloroflexota bacterium]|jgi:hypothetical protein